jgi:hypothetical protein
MNAQRAREVEADRAAIAAMQQGRAEGTSARQVATIYDSLQALPPGALSAADATWLQAYEASRLDALSRDVKTIKSQTTFLTVLTVLNILAGIALATVAATASGS